MQNSLAQRRTNSFYIKRITGLILLLFTAAVFLFSGISKLYAFDPFVWNIMDAGITNMTFASILARLFIGFELLLGLFLIFHLFLKSFTYPAILALLFLFTIYLIILIARQGNDGNCGCFGDAYEMKPSAAIIKNAVMIIATIILLYIYPIKSFRNAEWIAAIVGMAALIAPFVFFPLSGEDKPEVKNEPIILTPLYRSTHPDNKPAPVELRNGKHIVAFMSLTCSHCIKAAFLLQVIHRQHPTLPIFFVLNGHPDFLSDFLKETHAAHVPHILFRGADEFQSMAGSGVPSIYYINNSVIERKANYFQLDPKYMYQWLTEK
ncbi:MAG TPA: hypothetical protein PL009_01645 [Flavipsychrobacter sp.]|nr:hypothetical protein [Flavipsychrobacter sp.]